MLPRHKLTYFSSDLEIKTYKFVMFIVLMKKQTNKNKLKCSV